MGIDLVYYHGNCPDGWCAAYVAHLQFPSAELVPLVYGGFQPEDIIAQAKDKRVLMVDFALMTRELNDALAWSAKSLLILDHHKTTEEVLKGAPYARFDMEKSGAGLAWDYLFGYMRIDQFLGCHPRPWWVNYTEDQDLWRFHLPNSRLINNWLNVQERSVERWAVLSTARPESVLIEARGVQAHVVYTVKHGFKDVQDGVWEIDGNVWTVGVVNNGHVGISEIGEAIYKAGYDIALIWREDYRGQIRFALRSEVVDVGAIAKKFPGGGGHKAAAGFETSIAVGRHLIDGILGRHEYEPITRCS
jgi:oligoribonuclease NrnB/cAMP/cGMP phosphodiesterase (DHH superfamily)